VASLTKQKYMQWRTLALVMVIAAAATGTLANQIDSSLVRRGLSFAGAALMALLALVGRSKISPDNMREWIRARSASEGLKTEVYQFVTRCGPYREGDPFTTLSERVLAITDGVKDLNRYVAGIDPAAGSAPQDPMSIEAYLAERVNDQTTNYYRKKAASEARLVSTLRTMESVLAIAGALLGAWASVVDQAAVAPWGAVITTAIAAIAAHLAAGRHELQVTTYTATALQLERLSSRFKDAHRERPPTAAEIDRLVTACEAAISVENQGWMVHWEKPV
jgi:hypothetical protein